MKLICVFVFAYAKIRFSHDAAHITTQKMYKLFQFLKVSDLKIEFHANCKMCQKASHIILKYFSQYQELNESRTRTTTSIDEYDAGMREEYETKLQDALRTMREEGEEQLRQVREEVEYLYERKVRLSGVQ